MRTFKTEGHNYCKFNYSNTSITIAVQSKCLEGTKIKSPEKTVNHMFDAIYIFNNALNENSRNLIESLIQAARTYQLSKKGKKEEK